MPDLTPEIAAVLPHTGDFGILPVCGNGGLTFANDSAIGILFQRGLVRLLTDGPKGLDAAIRALHPLMDQPAGHTMFWADVSVIGYLQIPPGQVFEDHGQDAPTGQEQYDPSHFVPGDIERPWTDGTNTADAMRGTDSASGDSVLYIEGDDGVSVISADGWTAV